MFDKRFTIFIMASRFINKHTKVNSAASHQCKFRLINWQQAKKSKRLVVYIKIGDKKKLLRSPVFRLAYNQSIMENMHPVDTCKIAFLLCFENNNADINCNIKYLKHIEPNVYSCSAINSQPLLKIKAQCFCFQSRETTFTIQTTIGAKEITLPAEKLIKIHCLLYGLGSLASMVIGYAAAEDIISKM